MTTLVAPSHDHTSAAIKHDVRKDIQALRAVAVCACLSTTCGPAPCPAASSASTSSSSSPAS